EAAAAHLGGDDDAGGLPGVGSRVAWIQLHGWAPWFWLLAALFRQTHMSHAGRNYSSASAKIPTGFRSLFRGAQ
ncbi:MAG: hypothetical protein SH850_00865, partial [Planctomycetaceae bacterium]|nr:hypothetical protein [Planctomycetaceae bacterium]